MREIKFRAWQGGRFNYWGFIKSRHSDDYEFHAIADTNAEPLSMTEKMERSQQYIGIEDINSIEIYKGDIVEKWCHCRGLERLSPLYNKGVGYYKSLTTTVKWSEQGLNYNIYPHHDDAYWEVIGNIYENKELLNENRE